MKNEEERCFASGMDGYLVKPVSIERLRSTLERWLPIQSDSSADETNSSAAIDRDVLAAWLADDRDSLDELLKKFQQTAIEAEREIEGASRRGNLTTLAATAHKLNGAALAVGARGVLPRLPRSSGRARPVTEHTAAICLGGLRFNYVARSRRLRHRVDHADLLSCDNRRRDTAIQAIPNRQRATFSRYRS